MTRAGLFARRAAVTAATAALLTGAGAGALAGTAQAAQQENIVFHHYATAADFAAGSSAGTQPASATGGITLASSGLTAGSYTDQESGTAISYQSGSWTSPWFATGFPFSELVSSWNAATPPGSWLKVQMQAETDQSALTKWYTMGIWAFGTSTIHRTSVNGQGDADGTVATDTFFAKDHPMVSYRLQVTLYRADGTAATPVLREVGAVASNAPTVNSKPSVPSPLGGAEGTVLSLPEYSQEIHTGEYPEFDGGGEAWCSPTSTDMVTTHWGTGPTAADLASMPPSTSSSAVQPTQDLSVDWTAMHTFDYAYSGTGNWPFNIAYAANYGLDGEVTQLHSLYEVEQFIKAGIPVVASIAFSSNQLPGFLFKSTAGHLLVIVGFTKTGDVVVDDPASTSDQAVQHVYDRTKFERDWLSSTGGIVYLIHPSSVPLPANLPGQPANW